MADWSNPTNATLYTDVLDELKARDEDLARLFNGGESNLPTNAVRLNRGTGQWENWNGSAWVALTIDVTKLNGQLASYYTNASNLSSGTIPNARFPATLPAASGVNLTSLNASNLGSGTVPDARFPTTLPAAMNAAAVGSYVSALRTYIYDDGAYPSVFPVDASVTKSAWESVGPTGSGASNIWTALNSVPSTARIIIVSVATTVNPNGIDRVASIQANARKVGSSAFPDGSTMLCTNDVLADDYTSGTCYNYDTVFIALDANRRFEIYWTDVNSDASNVDLYLKGFMS